MISHALYSWHHSHHILYCIHCICVITTPLFMISGQLYVSCPTHYIYDILCTIHSVISMLYDFTPLSSPHFIHCIHYITHTIYDITNMTSQTLYLPSHTLYLTLHSLYLCHQTQCIIYTTPTLWMTLHTLYV